MHLWFRGDLVESITLAFLNHINKLRILDTSQKFVCLGQIEGHHSIMFFSHGRYCVSVDLSCHVFGCKLILKLQAYLIVPYTCNRIFRTQRIVEVPRIAEQQHSEDHLVHL